VEPAMQHDKYAIINNRTIFFGSMTAEWCDETAQMIEEGEDNLSIVEFVERGGQMVAEGRSVQIKLIGDLEMFEEMEL
jgi:hypothetical protein